MKTLERLWLDDCVVYGSERVVKPSGADGFGWVVRWEGLGKLSFPSRGTAAASDGVAASLDLRVKVFLPVEVEVPAGCRIDVRRGSRVYRLKACGVPAVFSGHQEVAVEDVQRWT